MHNFWSPVNIATSLSKGISFSNSMDYKFNQNSSFSFLLQYDFTRAMNSKTNLFLAYTPQHVISFVSGYHYKRLKLDFNWHSYGKVFTNAVNNESLPAYNLANLNTEMALLPNVFFINFQIRNLFNTKYQIIEQRPMPLRNFAFSFKYHFQ